MQENTPISSHHSFLFCNSIKLCSNIFMFSLVNLNLVNLNKAMAYLMLLKSKFSIEISSAINIFKICSEEKSPHFNF